MILVYGELLADMVGTNEGDSLKFNAFPGGGPFNLAVNAKQAGAKVGFTCRVGNDPVGRFLLSQVKKANFDYLDVQIDDVRNTTLAFVTLTNGERDFAFHRHDTADYFIEVKDIDTKKFNDINLIHLCSLLLSEENGPQVANEIIKLAHKNGTKISFDVNLRMDLFDTVNDAKRAYKPYFNEVDIIKFSDDEIKIFAEIDDLDKAIDKMYKKDTLMVVSLGAKGSMCKYNEITVFEPTQKLTPVDTTGAGDSFFGTFLANIENKDWSEENIRFALKKGNEAGAKTTQFYGGVKL